MALTVTEKEHWKDRISRRIDQAIRSLCAAEDPGFLSRIEDLARERALQSLRIEDLEKQVAEVKAKRKDLVREENHTYRKMLAIVKRWVDAASVGYSRTPFGIEQAIQLRQEHHEKELLGESPLGRRILALREEKEELLDTVWLATSCKQVKELWQQVTELLKQEPTPLQAKAMKLEPVADLPEH